MSGANAITSHSPRLRPLGQLKVKVLVAHAVPDGGTGIISILHCHEDSPHVGVEHSWHALNRTKPEGEHFYKTNERHTLHSKHLHALEQTRYVFDWPKPLELVIDRRLTCVRLVDECENEKSILVAPRGSWLKPSTIEVMEKLVLAKDLLRKLWKQNPLRIDEFIMHFTSIS